MSQQEPLYAAINKNRPHLCANLRINSRGNSFQAKR